jgi:DNA repair exonuclease SbcCD nuclease subunit
MGMSTFRCIHLADLHLGFVGNTSLLADPTKDHADPSEAGRYLREVDIERMVRWVTRRLCKLQDPPIDLVVIAGDLFDRRVPLPRAIEYAAIMVNYLIRAQIEVILVEGNHEMTTSTHTGSPLSYLRELGAHVFNTSRYELLYQSEHWYTSRLRTKQGLALHTLPYRALREKAFEGVHPLPDMLNLLVTHGRVDGSYEKNTLGDITATIPPALLRQAWDYIALGDWHIHRYQPLSNLPAYYAGSLEALNFGEAALYPPRAQNNAYALHGMLDIRLTQGKTASIETIPYPNSRPVLRLEAIEASSLDADTLMAQIEQRLTSPLPANALCRLDILAYDPLIWDQLDHQRIHELRQRVRLCDIRWHPKRIERADQEDASSASLNEQWAAFLRRHIENETERCWYLQQGCSLLEAARAQTLSAQNGRNAEGDRQR